MDISNRNAHSQAAGPSGQSLNASSAGVGGPRRSNKSEDNKLIRLGMVVALVALAVLLAGLLALSVSRGNDGGSGKSQSSYVDTKKLQAVFLNTGQVYFGNIKSLNSQYFVLSNIYYLQTNNGANNNSSVTLVKLGCELHQPNDQMVINSEQVTFWENLGDNGQVAKAVADFKQKNPNGQNCADQSSSAPANSGNAAQNANGNNAAGNNP
jgi:hypothetical protein